MIDYSLMGYRFYEAGNRTIAEVAETIPDEHFDEFLSGFMNASFQATEVKINKLYYRLNHDARATFLTALVMIVDSIDKGHPPDGAKESNDTQV